MMRTSGRVRHALDFLTVGCAVLLGACGRAPAGQASPVARSPVATASSSLPRLASNHSGTGVWSDGPTIPGGNRYTVTGGGIGWIMTKPTDNGQLTITKVSLGPIAFSKRADGSLAQATRDGTATNHRRRRRA
jgi:hypothetical protein